MTAPTPQPPPAPAPDGPLTDTTTVTGKATITVTRADGTLRSRTTAGNQITDSGDQYHARCIAAGVLPVDLADVPRVTGMKLGTGTTTPAKSGPGAALVAYVPGSGRPFDAGYPTVESLGAGDGWIVTYQCTFGPGVGTAAALTEVVMVLDAAADATSGTADTIARLTFAATPKGSTDSMEIQWDHKQQGTATA